MNICLVFPEQLNLLATPSSHLCDCEYLTVAVNLFLSPCLMTVQILGLCLCLHVCAICS